MYFIMNDYSESEIFICRFRNADENIDFPKEISNNNYIVAKGCFQTYESARIKAISEAYDSGWCYNPARNRI